MTDRQLLAEYAERASQGAFAEIVERHLPMIYSTCFRILRDPGEAEDAAQAVFLVLARKAGKLGGSTVLAGWLFRTAENGARRALRARARRARHEREAAVMREAEREKASWKEIAPELDAALAALPAEQRDAIALRYLQGRPEKEIAAELGCTRNAVAMRISRGIGRLRGLLSRRGVALPAAVLAGALVERTIETVPTGAASRVCSVCSGQAAPSAAAASISEGIMKGMLWTKIKVAAAVVVGAAVLGGGGAVTVGGLGAAEPKPGKLNPQVVATEDNTWLKLNPKRQPRSRMYSGCWLGEGRLMFFGGGHGAYRYNDVELYYTAENSWQQATEREAWTEIKGAEPMGGGPGVGLLSPKLRPLGEHTFQQFCWLPDRKVFFGVLVSGTWEFDPGKKTWQCLAGLHAGKPAGKAGPLTPAKYEKVPLGKSGSSYVVPAWKTRDGRKVTNTARAELLVGQGVQRLLTGTWRTSDGKPASDVSSFQPYFQTGAGLVVYDPVTGKPLCLEAGTSEGRTLWVFDHKKMAWEKLLFARIRKSVSNYSTYVSCRKRHIVISQDAWHWVDAAAKKVEKIDGVPKALAWCQAITYDSRNKVVLLLGGVPVRKHGRKVEVWKLDPATGKFEKLPAPAGAIPKGGSTGRWGTFWYDAAHNACFFVNQLRQGGHEGSPCETWAYRYRRAAKK